MWHLLQLIGQFRHLKNQFKIQRSLRRRLGKAEDKRYAKLLEVGIIDKETWPRPPKEKRVQSWEGAKHKEWHIRNMAIYAAMVDHMDQAVGKIVDALKETNKLDDTFIIYFHDNGACAEHLSGNGWNTADNVIEKAGKWAEVYNWR